MQGCKGGRAFWMKDSPGAITKVHSEPKALIQMVMIITLKWVWEDPLPLGKLRYQTGKNTTKWEKAFLPRNGRNSCHQEFPGMIKVALKTNSFNGSSLKFDQKQLEYC